MAWGAASGTAASGLTTRENGGRLLAVRSDTSTEVSPLPGAEREREAVSKLMEVGTAKFAIRHLNMAIESQSIIGGLQFGCTHPPRWLLGPLLVPAANEQ